MNTVAQLATAAVLGLFVLCAHADDPNEVATREIQNLQDQITILQTQNAKNEGNIEALKREQEFERDDALRIIQSGKVNDDNNCNN